MATNSSVIGREPLAGDTYYSYVRNSIDCQAMSGDYYDGRNQPSVGIEPSMRIWQLIVILLGLGCFYALVAAGFNYIRRKVYNDKGKLDTHFDAGGKVSVGLTATTIVAQWIWAATLLQSSGVGSKYGVSGPYWYAAGATIQILLFSMISVQLKIRAPGAKTFLQVVYARFGKPTHIVFCIFALLTNIIVTAMLMLGGAAILTNLVKGLSVELATGMVAVVIGIYPFIGGLGATFYVSYFNTMLIFILLIIFMAKVFLDPNDNSPVGTVDNLYTYLNCSQGPDGNKEESFLTMVSRPGLIFGIINIIGNFGTVFVDQSYWQSSVAAKPRQGVWGFLSGGLVWFAVPFTFATTMGMAYISFSAQQGAPLLTGDDVDKGLVPAIVAQKLMGETGEILLVFMILMAITSTGAAEVIAVSSIVVYDIYQVYIRPYRRRKNINSCILCGRPRGRYTTKGNECLCISMRTCKICHDDTKALRKERRFKTTYQCHMHGAYREYNDYLFTVKNWALLWSTLAIVPLTLILYVLGVSLGWVYLFMGVLIGSAVVPIALCMFWARLNSAGMISGAVVGAAAGIATWLGMASLEPGGLRDFQASTGAEYSMLVGNLVAILGGGLITIVVTLITNCKFTEADADETWERTRDLDSPLSPWTELYARDLKLTAGVNQLGNRASLDEVTKAFKDSRIVAYVGSILLTLILIIAWPGGMQAEGVFTPTTFKHWVNVAMAWTIIAALFIVILPVVNEIIDIRAAIKERRSIKLETPVNYSMRGAGRMVYNIASQITKTDSNARTEAEMNNPNLQTNSTDYTNLQTEKQENKTRLSTRI